jgi:integrase
MSAATKTKAPAPAPAARYEAPIPDCLDADELARFFAAVTGRGKTALRNRAMLMVAHDAALRSDEVVNLRRRDVDIEAGEVYVKEGKGGKDRRIRNCLHTDTKQALRAWLAHRETLGWDDRKSVLFGTFYSRPGRGKGDNRAEHKGGGALATSYLRRLVPSLARKAGVAKKAHPHLLRHTRAREWSDKGRPVPDIQHDLGHKNLATTSFYLRRFASAGADADQYDRGA